MEILAVVSLLGCFGTLIAAASYANREREATRVSHMVSIPALPPIACVADELDTYEVSPALANRLAA